MSYLPRFLLADGTDRRSGTRDRSRDVIEDANEANQGGEPETSKTIETLKENGDRRRTK